MFIHPLLNYDYLILLDLDNQALLNFNNLIYLNFDKDVLTDYQKVILQDFHFNLYIKYLVFLPFFLQFNLQDL